MSLIGFAFWRKSDPIPVFLFPSFFRKIFPSILGMCLLGRVFVQSNPPDLSILAHELAHIRQEDGHPYRFLWRYLCSFISTAWRCRSLSDGYWYHPKEVAARVAAINTQNIRFEPRLPTCRKTSSSR